MGKHLIYIIAIDHNTSQFKNSDYAQYSINTWKYYCEKYGIDLLIIDENVGGYDFPIWNKELVHKFGKGYDKIGVVDSDTMIRWDAPNIFDQVNDGIYGVNDLCDLNWLLSSVQDRQRFFPDVKLDLMKYLNAGVLFLTKEYLYVFKELLEFYQENKDEIHKIKGGGKEQTLLNFFIQKNQIPINLLLPSWNLLSIHKKNMFQFNWQLNIDQTSYFLKYAYIWHFTGFPIEVRTNIMSQVWNAIKQNY